MNILLFDSLNFLRISKITPMPALSVMTFMLSTVILAFQTTQDYYPVHPTPGPVKLEKIADSLSAIFLKKNLLPGLAVTVFHPRKPRHSSSSFESYLRYSWDKGTNGG